MNEIYNLNLCDNTFDKELDESSMKVLDVLMSAGYTDEESKKIIDEYKLKQYGEDTLIDLFEKLGLVI